MLNFNVNLLPENIFPLFSKKKRNLSEMMLDWNKKYAIDIIIVKNP